MALNGLQGQLDGLLLAVLQDGPLHGYAIVSELRRRSHGEFDVAEGTIYPALHKLELAGLLASHWQVVDGRRRRVYALSQRGREAVGERLASWRRLSRAIDAVFTPAEAGS